MKNLKILKQIFLLWLIYKVFHFFFFQTFFYGFLSSFDFISSIFPDGLSFFKEPIHIKPFQSFSLLFSAFKNPLFLIGFCISIAVFFRQYKKFNWSNYEYNYWIKLLVFLTGLLITWEFTSYSYNYYLDSFFIIDRLLLVFLLFGMVYHPIAIPLFIVVSLLFRSQFSIPIGGFPFFDKRVLFDLLILVYAYIFISRWRKLDISILFLMVFCIVGGNYFATGISKILNSPHGFEWLVENKLNWLFLNANSRGWLIELSSDSLQVFSGFLYKWSIPLQFIVLLIELSGIILLLNKKYSPYILIGTIGMHLAIFLVGSMFFWKWIVIDLFLIYFLWKAPKQLISSIFESDKVKISMLIIAFSIPLFDSFQIGWHDTPYNQLYSYQVKCEDGKTYSFEKNSFDPYHQLFQYDKFPFLNKEKQLKVSGFGYTSNYKLAREIRNSNWEELEILTNKYGQIKYDLKMEKEFKDFLKTFFSNYNLNRNRNVSISKLSPPFHIYNHERGLIYEGQSNIKTVEVYHDCYFIENNISVLKEHKLVLQIPI